MPTPSSRPRPAKPWILLSLPLVGILAGASFRLGFDQVKRGHPPQNSVEFASRPLSCDPNLALEAPRQADNYFRTTAPMVAKDEKRTAVDCQAIASAPQFRPRLPQLFATKPVVYQSIVEDEAAQNAVFSGNAVLFRAISDPQQAVYPVVTPPPFTTEVPRDRHPSLTSIVEGALARLTQANYPTATVSISLVDLTGDCCDYAAYQDTQKRYPASIAKLFWAVALAGYEDAGRITPTTLLSDDEALMLHNSNNGASSRIVDALTQTESGAALDDTAIAEWSAARQRLNNYFKAANYTSLNIVHKTFPIPDLGLSERTGRDLQFAQGEYATAIANPDGRNYLTTFDTARLLYEIDAGKAVSATHSDRIKAHLKHSTHPDDWQADEYNAIADFFGEYLPPDVDLYTKLGYTFNDGRQEAAIIASADGKTRFILVMFANDPVYSQAGSKAFPDIARYVYDQMRSRVELPQASAPLR